MTSLSYCQAYFLRFDTIAPPQSQKMFYNFIHRLSSNLHANTSKLIFMMKIEAFPQQSSVTTLNITNRNPETQRWKKTSFLLWDHHSWNVLKQGVIQFKCQYHITQDWLLLDRLVALQLHLRFPCQDHNLSLNLNIINTCYLFTLDLLCSAIFLESTLIFSFWQTSSLMFTLPWYQINDLFVQSSSEYVSVWLIVLVDEQRVMKNHFTLV